MSFVTRHVQVVSDCFHIIRGGVLRVLWCQWCRKEWLAVREWTWTSSMYSFITSSLWLLSNRYFQVIVWCMIWKFQNFWAQYKSCSFDNFRFPAISTFCPFMSRFKCPKKRSVSRQPVTVSSFPLFPIFSYYRCLQGIVMASGGVCVLCCCCFDSILVALVSSAAMYE